MALSGVSDFQYYAEAVAKASERARACFFVTMVLTCGLLVVLVEQSLMSWGDARMAVADQLIKTWSGTPAYEQAFLWVDRQKIDDVDRTVRKVAELQAEYPRLRKKNPKLPLWPAVDIAKIREDINILYRARKDLGITSKQAAESLHKRMTERRHSRGTIKLPLVDYVCDTNNLTLLAGFVLLFCTLVLKLALSRELATLKSAYDVAHESFDYNLKKVRVATSAVPVDPKLEVPDDPAKKEEMRIAEEAAKAKDAENLQSCRDLLCMGMVLINPQKGVSSAERFFFSLLYFPALVVGIQWLSDFDTRHVGFGISPTFASVSLTLGCLCFLFCLGTAIAATNVARAINQFWTVWEDKSGDSPYERHILQKRGAV